MKKNIKIAATLTLTCALALTIGTISFASGQKNDPTPASIETVANEAEYTEDYEVFEENTWLTAKDPSVDEGIRRLFDEINMSDNTEAYCPTAVLAYMVSDEGTSWKVLAEVNTIIPEASSNYTILEIFEDMEGKVRIEKEYPTMLEPYTYDNGIGWTACEDPSFADNEFTRFEEAVNTVDGIYLKPVAKLATQVVAGINYCIICERTPVTPGAGTKYSLIYVYEDMDGTMTVDENASIHLYMGDDEEAF